MRYTFLIYILLMIGCSDDDSAAIEVREARMLEISNTVEALTANKSCNGGDDCASIAWGSKPCGGPWGYLVYASSNVDVQRLEQLAAEFQQLESEVNVLKKLGSDCAVVTEPELECADNICTAK